MPYRIAGIDVHKRMLAVVVSDAEVDGEYQFERQMDAPEAGRHRPDVGNAASSASDTEEDLSFQRLTLEGASGDPVAGVQ